MERAEISRHEVQVFAVLARKPAAWLSNTNIAAELDDVAPRTVRQHTQRLVKLGLVEQREVFPGHRFRLAEKARQRNGGYLDRLNGAAEALGIPLP